MDGQGSPALFEAVIVPHRSLSRRGVAVLVVALSLLCFLIGLRCLLLGAWPVICFSAAEVGLAVSLIWLNVRRARAVELVVLSEDGVRIARTDMHGRRTEKTLSADWLNVVLEEEPGRVPALLLSARGRKEEIGTVLGEPEKRDLAAALSAALYRMRHPRFDNPQLSA
jgi:uncharacterized membrane protein